MLGRLSRPIRLLSGWMAIPRLLGTPSRSTLWIWPNRANETVSVSWRAHWLGLSSEVASLVASYAIFP